MINVNTAPREVLMALPGMSDAAAERLLSRREIRPFQGMDDVLGALWGEARAQLVGNYDAFARIAVFNPPQWVAAVEGGVCGTPLIARTTLVTISVSGRLAILRRETE